MGVTINKKSTATEPRSTATEPSPEFYSDLVYQLKKIVGSNYFSGQVIKIIFHHKKIGYNINVLH